MPEQYSDYQKDCLLREWINENPKENTKDNFILKAPSTVKKLMPTFGGVCEDSNSKDDKNAYKYKYVLSIDMLRFALEQGLILKKVHRVIQYTQKTWLEPYIALNTNYRKGAKNAFEKAAGLTREGKRPETSK